MFCDETSLIYQCLGGIKSCRSHPRGKSLRQLVGRREGCLRLSSAQGKSLLGQGILTEPAGFRRGLGSYPTRNRASHHANITTFSIQPLAVGTVEIDPSRDIERSSFSLCVLYREIILEVSRLDITEVSE